MIDKKVLLLTALFFVFSSLFLTGCVGSKQDETVTDADGNMLRYSLNDLYNQSLVGFFIKNTDETFTPVFSGMQNYTGTSILSALNINAEKERFIWFSDTATVIFNKLVPVVTKDTPLVGFFKENKEMPEEYYLEKYNPLGFTIGCTFVMAEDQSSLLMDTSNICEGSSLATYIEDQKLSGEYEVKKFNETNDLPIKNIDTATGLLLGLEEGARYQIGYYDGTVYHSTTRKNFTIKADCRVFKSGGMTSLGIPFNKSEDNYFKIILPDNLEAGYYYINDYGLFKYSP